MPELAGKKYPYTKKGKVAYIKALRKKRKENEINGGNIPGNPV